MILDPFLTAITVEVKKSFVQGNIAMLMAQPDICMAQPDIC